MKPKKLNSKVKKITQKAIDLIAKAELTPERIVSELNQHVIGQAAAKRAIAIAFRNQWRRSQLSELMRKEITPKNILFIGPTGCGKTELARRFANFINAPFIKVEATKFTEVGYVGRDVDSIIRDLVDTAIKRERERKTAENKTRAEELAIEKILDALLPQSRDVEGVTAEEVGAAAETGARRLFRKRVISGELNEQEIEIEIAVSSVGVEIMAPPGMEEMTSQLQSMFSSFAGSKTKKKKMKVKDALKQIAEDEALNMINEEEMKKIALQNVEQNGIVFIDEIDKIVDRVNHSNGGPSREGVQRDLLPLVEGCTVSTRYGMVKTDHILFIASGAFHLAKPSDLIPELQGRFPIRVEFHALSADDFFRILTEPTASLTEQYTALLNVDGVQLTFAEEGIRRIAEIAYQVNETTENIGARRLHTVMERLLEEISFHSTKLATSGKNNIVINAAYVNKQLSKLAADADWSRSIL